MSCLRVLRGQDFFLCAEAADTGKSLTELV